MAKMVVSELLQPFQLGVDGSSAGEIGVESGLLGVHRGLREVIDDTSMNALFNQEAKRVIAHFSSSNRWLPLCHTDKLFDLCQANLNTQNEALRCRNPPWR
ncbi:MAG: hypothetical protein WAX67_06035 [Rugosibacter sp.]